MSEYWKSLPRKYCDTCKCWFADNKASLEFHEKGKRHQENVQKRINQIQKKGLKEYKAKKELEDEMLKIEKAALAAFKKDMKNNPDLTAQCIQNSIDAVKVMEAEISNPEKTVEIPNPEKVKKIPKKQQPKVPKKDNSVPKEEVPDKRIWYEGVSDEGHTYYWNSETSESQWEPPEEEYISLQEQNEPYPETSSQEADEKPEESEKKSNSKKDNADEAISIGPQPKPDPYGQWVTVEKKEVQHVDLELPVLKDDGVEVHISLPKEDRLKIKEKTVGHLSSTEYGASESTFKKRKNLGGAKRSIRQRLDES